MRIILIFFTAVAISIAFTSGASKCNIQLEGFYHSPIDSNTSAYLRFYKDGTVLHTTSIQKPEEVIKYLNKEHAKQVLRGDYSFGKCYVTMSVYGNTGKMKFAGSVKGDSLFLKANNINDGTSTNLTFAFFEEPIPTSKK